MADSRLNFSMSLFVSDSSEWPAGAIPESCELAEPQKPSAQTEKSIERLIATESQTEEIMSPPIIRSIAKKTAGVIKAPSCYRIASRTKAWKDRKREESILAGEKATHNADFEIKVPEERNDSADVQPTLPIMEPETTKDTRSPPTRFIFKPNRPKNCPSGKRLTSA